MEHQVRRVHDPPDIEDYHGRSIRAIGIISFRWKHIEGTNIHDPAEFYVGPRDDIDMIFGRQYINQTKLLTPNKDRMLVMMAHEQKKSRGESMPCSLTNLDFDYRVAEQTKISELEQRQRQGKATVDAFRQSHPHQAQSSESLPEHYGFGGHSPNALGPQTGYLSRQQPSSDFQSYDPQGYPTQPDYRSGEPYQGFETLPRSQGYRRGRYTQISSYTHRGIPERHNPQSTQGCAAVQELLDHPDRYDRRTCRR